MRGCWRRSAALNRSLSRAALISNWMALRDSMLLSAVRCVVHPLARLSSPARADRRRAPIRNGSRRDPTRSRRNGDRRPLRLVLHELAVGDGDPIGFLRRLLAEWRNEYLTGVGRRRKLERHPALIRCNSSSGRGRFRMTDDRPHLVRRRISGPAMYQRFLGQC